MIEGLRASSSPHLRQPRSISGIMVDVCIALLPAALYGVFQFGWNAAMVMAVSVFTAVATEVAIELIFHKPRTIHDFSAVVTGMLVGMSCPPIAALRYGTASTYGDLFLGNVAGCIGEVSKLLLLLGAAYLVIRGVIRLYTPVALLGTLFLLTWAFGGDAGLFTGDGLYAILSGSAILCAFFMATDYTTSPVTGAGQAIMGFGVGLIIFIIRTFGAYPEGVTYALMFMNILTPLIDRFVRPKVYGEVKQHG